MGDAVVTDSKPLPTSKNQCKNSGWQTYAIFKNQGDCVSFVRAHARRACVFEKVAHGMPALRAKYGIGAQHRRAMWACFHRSIGS